MITIAYYSPTGNTKYLALCLAKCLGNDTRIINIAKNEPLPPTKHLILMGSIHAFRLPAAMFRFFKQPSSNAVESWSVISVGCNTEWINQGAAAPLIRMGKKKGMNLHLYRVLAMPLTLIVKFKIAQGKEVVESATAEIKEIAHAIKTGQRDKVQIPILSLLMNKIGIIESTAARLFGLELNASKKCIHCMKCVKECPTHNIYFDKKIKFKLKCMICLNCIYTCPTQAIKPMVTRFLPIKDGYHLSDYINKEEKL